MARMLCICPTFKRVDMCSEMIKSFKETAVHQDYHSTKLVLGLSENDPNIHGYIQLAHKEGVGIYISKSNSVTVVINEIYEASKDFDFYHLLNDDVIYQTENWHIVLMQMLIMKGGGISFGNDLLQEGKLCTFPVISASVAAITGWLQYPRLNCLCGDNVWYEIGAKTPCLHYNSLIIIEHKTWINEKREHDKPEYQAMLQPDWLHYQYFVENDLKDIVLKIRDQLNITTTQE